MPRRLLGATLALVLLSSLTACALPLPFPKPPGGGIPMEQEAEPGAALETSSCVRKVQARVVDADELVSCSGAHAGDVVALLEWPGMADLVAQHTPQLVWDELSGNYAVKGLSVDYDRWSGAVCRDALREAAGWDGVRISGLDGSELDLIPAGAFEVVAAIADADAFVDGDHRTRCVVEWFEAVAYDDGGTIADITSPGFPSAARDCYLLEADGYVYPAPCDSRHTEQAMLSVDAVDVFGPERVRGILIADERAQLEADRFCEDAILAVLGAWDEDRYWIWGMQYYSDDWAAIGNGAADADGYYPIACTLSTYAGEYAFGDAFAEYPPIGAG